MADHSSPPTQIVGERFKEKIALMAKKRTYNDPNTQKVIADYYVHPEKSQRTIEYDKLSYLGQILYDDARRPNETGLPRWERKKSLGGGSYGVVTMWERYVGPNQEPLRLACKITSFDSFYHDVCEEANLTHAVNESGCVNVVKVIDWKVDLSRERSMILYEYLPQGTLGDFTRYHDTHCSATMPEAMIWHVFHSLATTICYHAHGTTAEERVEGWDEIIHRDIKPYNVLMAEPDPNNRPLYPTIKLADYGLAYSQNDAIREAKGYMWSAGTKNYSAPELMYNVRTDKAQTPHHLIYPETDIFSVGCIILEMMRIPFGRYQSDTHTLIDYEFVFPYESVPYSDILRDLAMDCVRTDVRTRPRVREVYKRTKHYADLWYSRINGPSVENPQDAYAGQALWSQGLRKRFETNMKFRWSYIIHNDWFYNHQASVYKLLRTTMDPGKANVPRGNLVAIGNGFAIEEKLTKLPGEVYLERPSLQRLRMRVFNRRGKLLRRRDGEVIRRVMRPQNFPPVLNEKWKEERVQLLESLLDAYHRSGHLNDDEKKEIISYGRELLKLKYDSPTRETSHRLRDLIRVRNGIQMRMINPDVDAVLQRFANEMINYLSCQTATMPQFSPIVRHKSNPSGE